MSPKTHNEIAKSTEDALAAFISRKQEIDQMLARLQALSDDHFGWSPDEISWAHVGTLGHYAELLKRRQRLQRGRPCRLIRPPAPRTLA